MTSGRVGASETRCMEAAVFFCEFKAAGDLGPAFGFVPDPGEDLAIERRVRAVAEFLGPRKDILTEAWLARLVQALVASEGPNEELELDLLAVMASNHGLCFWCFLPLRVRRQDLAVVQASGASLCTERGVKGLETGQPPNSCWRLLDHEGCKRRATSAKRLARGRGLLLQAAQAGV